MLEDKNKTYINQSKMEGEKLSSDATICEDRSITEIKKGWS